MNSRLILFCTFLAFTAILGHAQQSIPDGKPLIGDIRLEVGTVSRLASALAASLANREAKARFGIEPFSAADGEAALQDGRWRWRALAGHGKADLQAEISFSQNGSDPKIDIQQLVNEEGFSIRR